MSTYLSQIDYQMNQMQSDMTAFRKNMDDQERVKEEEKKLGKMLSEADLVAKGKGHKKGEGQVPASESAQTAFVLAMAQMMTGRLEVMGANADHMTSLQPQLEKATQALQSLQGESGGLETAYHDHPEDQMAEGQIINQQAADVTSSVAAFGVEDGKDSASINFLSSQNNADAGMAGYMIDAIVRKEGRFRG